MKIANKISFSFILAIIGMTIIVLSPIYISSKDHLTKSIEDHLQTTVSSRAETIETFLVEAKRKVEVIAQSAFIQDAVGIAKDMGGGTLSIYDEINEELKRYITNQTDIKEIYILNMQGIAVASTDKNILGSDHASHNPFNEGQLWTHVTDAYYSQDAKGSSILIATPILNDELMDISGVLIATVSMDRISDIATGKIGLGDSGEIYLVNGDKYMLTPLRFLKDTVLKEKVENINSSNCFEHSADKDKLYSGDSSIFTNYRDVSVLGSYQYISEMNWCLLAEIDVKEAFSPLEKIKKLFLIVLFGIPILAFIISRLISRSISKPIHKLQAGIKEIGSGNLDYKVGTISNDEIGELSRAFDEMTSDLQRTTTSIDELNREVAERRAAEEKIKEAAEEWKTTFNSIDDLISIQAKDFTLLRVNRAYADAFSATPDELMGKKCYELVHDSKRPKDNCPHTKCIETGVSVTEESFEPNLGIYVETTASPIIGKDGNLVGTVHITKNITERKKAEEQIKRFRKFTDASGQGFGMSELDGTVTYANFTLAKLVGLESADEMIGTSVFDCYSPQNLEMLKNDIFPIVQKEGQWLGEIPLLRRDKSEIPTIENIFTIYDEDGKPAFLANVVTDITVQKQAEEQMKESELRYRALYEGSRDGYMMVDTSGRIKESNIAYQEMLGYSQEELAELTQNDITPKKWHAMEEKIVQYEIFDIGYSSVYEKEYINKDGKIIPIEIRTYLMRDLDGNPVGMWAYVRDITERKKVEAALKEYTKKVEEINKELDDFTYIVSHDLKEPLRSIDAFSKFAIDDYGDKIDAEGLDYLTRVRANATRMQKLIEDLLAISRIDRKQNPFEEVSMDKTIEDVRLRVEYSLKEKNVEFIVQDNLPKIFCDRVRIAEVFANLASNAIKFLDKENPKVEIGYNDKRDDYEFYVRDNGAGIEAQYFTKIFEIFQRLGKREQHEGTGAGLTIVKKIIQMHNGKVWVDSKLGEGATFYFTIPKDKAVIIGKKKIGEILVEKNLVTEDDVRQALEEQG